MKAIEVLGFFKTADLDTAELILSLAEEALKDRQADHKAAVARAAKARAGKGKSGNGVEKPAQAGTPVGESGIEAVPPSKAAKAPTSGHSSGHAPSPARVPAPAHTAQATAVEADNE